MALAYIVDGGLNDPPGHGTELYEAFPAVRELYARAAEWTGVPVKRLLSWELDRVAEYRQVGVIRQTAVALGVCDVLAEQGVRPGVVAGMSRGSVIGAAIARAVDRRELIDLLNRLRDVPSPAGPAQGIAQLFVPPGVKPEEFAGEFPEGVYLAGDIGPVANGTAYLVLVSGYQDALRQLADQLQDKTAIRIPRDVASAFHSPLRNHVREFQKPYLAAMDIRDPEVPLCGGLEQGIYTTAEQVREMFGRNHTDAVSLPRLVNGLERNGTELAVLLGPGLVELYRSAMECPIVHIEKPSHVTKAVDAVRQLGMLPSAR